MGRVHGLAAARPLTKRPAPKIFFPELAGRGGSSNRPVGYGPHLDQHSPLSPLKSVVSRGFRFPSGVSSDACETITNPLWQAELEGRSRKQRGNTQGAGRHGTSLAD